MNKQILTKTKNMKKLLLLIIVSFICVSCYNSKTHENDALETYAVDVPYTYTKQIMIKGNSYTFGQITSIRHFIYNGHEYIQYHVYGGYGGGYGFVHDPDCKCTKSEK